MQCRGISISFLKHYNSQYLRDSSNVVINTLNLVLGKTFKRNILKNPSASEQLKTAECNVVTVIQLE